MEKDQVTFVVQASEVGRPLPNPIMVVGLSSSGGHRELVVMAARNGVFKGDKRYHLGPAWIKASEADLISQAVADTVYGYLASYVGIEGTLEALP